MEVIINKHTRNSLSTKVFFSDESGFSVASVIVMGQTDAVLLDAQWTLSNGHRVAAEILESGKQLKTIYVTHAHQKPGMPFDVSSFKFMKDYLAATEEELARTNDTASFFYAMALRFSEANLIFLSNEMNAAVFKGQRDWNWRDE